MLKPMSDKNDEKMPNEGKHWGGGKTPSTTACAESWKMKNMMGVKNKNRSVRAPSSMHAWYRVACVPCTYLLGLYQVQSNSDSKPVISPLTDRAFLVLWSML